jgi:hypothetical protein
MTEVVATRRYEFKCASEGNVSQLAGLLNDKLYRTLNRNRCEAIATVDPKNPLTIVVEMKCATGADIYSLDKDTILKMISESEKERIDHHIGSLELQV